jgi:5-methylcytosine-specific restriction endonuclease McrA
MKVCSRCKQGRPSSAFGENPRAEDGRDKTCQGCLIQCRRYSVMNTETVALRKLARRTAPAASPDGSKVCRCCCVVRPLSTFGENKRRADGYNKTCRRCLVRERARQIASPVVHAWRKTYRQTGLEAAIRRAWLSRRPGYSAAGNKRYKAKHPVRAAALAMVRRKKWEAKYPERAKANRMRRGARLREAVKVGDVTGRQWSAILLFYGHACARCRVAASVRPLSVDHFIPLSKGGTHSADNVWPLCLPCNQRKSNRLPNETHPPHVAILREALA